jgi:hypothetical protein
VNRFARIFLIFGVGVLCGCSQQADQAGTAESDDGDHTHTAPHGGQLVELGDHAASLEVVVNAATGALDLYVLDAHAEGYVRLPAPALTVGLKWKGTTEPIVVELPAVANPLTGETAGNTSRFSAIIPQLVGKTDVDLTVSRIEIGGALYSDVAVHVHP